MMSLFHRKSKKDEDVVLRTDHDDELEEMAEDQSQKKRKKSNSKFFQLLSDSHHKIERKAISFLSVFLVLCLGIGISLSHAHHDTVQQENETTNLSSNVGWSLASGTFKIGKAWTTPNRSLVVVPLTFSANAFQSISSDATHYAIKIGTMDKYLQSCPKAQLILFGNTTQGALVIQNVEKFPSQVMMVVFEELKQLSNQDNSDNQDQNGDNSGDALQQWMNTYGKKHNVTYFKINPGASQVNVFDKDVSFKSLNLKYLYNTLFANSERKTVENNIAKTQNDLTYQLRQAQNYMRTIDAAGYKTPQEPPWLDSKWRPANMVDPDTGHQNAANDNAQEQYQAPQDLTHKDGKGSMQQDANTVDNDNNLTNNNNSNQTASSQPQFGQAAQAESAMQALNSLQNIWTNIYNDKINLYVTYNQQLYNLKYIANQQRQTATESLMKNFKVISPERVNK